MTKTKTEIASRFHRPVKAAHIGRYLAFRQRGEDYTATLSNDGTALLVDVADPTGPDGQRSFVVEFTVREVT